MMKKFSGFEIGIVAILFGVGLLLTSVILSTGGYSRLSFIQNIPHREIVIFKGEVVPEKRQYREGPFGGTVSTVAQPSYVKGRVSIPLKLALSISTLLILTGIGCMALGNRGHRKSA